MSHHIEAFIGKPEHLEGCKNLQNARIIPLPEGLAILPVTDALYDEVYELNKGDDDDDERTDPINILANAMAGGPVVLVNTDYFGGAGEQKATVYDKGKKIQKFTRRNPINQALHQFLGVQETENKDQFDVLGLGRWRSNDDWVENNP